MSAFGMVLQAAMLIARVVKPNRRTTFLRIRDSAGCARVAVAATVDELKVNVF